MKPNKKTTHLHLQKGREYAIGQENRNDVFGFILLTLQIVMI